MLEFTYLYLISASPPYSCISRCLSHASATFHRMCEQNAIPSKSNSVIMYMSFIGISSVAPAVRLPRESCGYVTWRNGKAFPACNDCWTLSSCPKRTKRYASRSPSDRAGASYTS